MPPESGSNPDTLDRIYLLDDDPLILAWAEAVLAAEGRQLHLFSEPLALLDALESAGRSQGARVVVIDRIMPGVDGLLVAQRLRDHGYDDPLILLSGHVDVPVAVDAMRAGFFQVLQKPLAAEQLRHEVEQSLVESRRRLAQRSGSEHRLDLERRLSARERQVLAALAEGCANKVVADRLGISIKTVETHRKHLMEKLGLRHAAELIRFGIATIGDAEPRRGRR